MVYRSGHSECQAPLIEFIRKISKYFSNSKAIFMPMQYYRMSQLSKPVYNTSAENFNMAQNGKPQPIAWHPAFIEALRLELEDYADSLEFHPEYQLTSEPLRIDCLVIKKPPDIVIKKNIAAIFREVNILEYRSPNDNVSVPDFYKVYGYACLYASLEKVPVTTMTISFIQSHYPRKLLAHLKNTRRYKVEETNPGIYTVEGDVLPIQIIDSRKLSADENLWLKNLDNGLDAPGVGRIAREIQRKGKEARVQAYINVITRANSDAIEEAVNMSKSAKSLEDVLVRTGIAARVEARGVAIGEAKGKERKALDIAKNLVSMGFPLETVVSATNLKPEKVRPLYKN